MLAASSAFTSFDAVVSLMLAVFGLVAAAVSAIAAHRSVVAADRAVAAAHGDAVTDRIYDSLGALLSVMVRLHNPLNAGDPDAELNHEFREMLEARERVELALRQRPEAYAEGIFLLDVLNNLASSVVQHREVSLWHAAPGIWEESRPGDISERTWDRLGAYQAFVELHFTLADLGQGDAQTERWADAIRKDWIDSHLKHISSVPDSVYSLDAPYLVQAMRLVGDFIQDEFKEWALKTVGPPNRIDRAI